MKKIVMMILITTLMISCSIYEDDIESKYNSKCEVVESSMSIYLYRCENKESICYVVNNGGVSCYFKESLKIKDGLDAVSNDFLNIN